MSESMGALSDGGRVVIVGGGPGGTACALALDRIAKRLDRKIQITLLEGKQFTDQRHYNQCVGVLSPPLPQLLEDNLAVPFPHQFCLVEIDGYVLHSEGTQILLGSDRDGSIAVRRVLFDGYMLDQVGQRGIPVWPVRAVDLEFHADRVMVYTENEPIEADVVVGAFGLDEGSAAIFSRATDYKPPKALNSILTKYSPEGSSMELGSKIHAFLPADQRIEFGAITPKCGHLAINIAGLTVDTDLMKAFLTSPQVSDVLKGMGHYDESYILEQLHFYKGRFPRSLARGYYGDRYIMIGDASGLVRAFKGKGSTTAVQTGIRAAEMILLHGISRQAFHEHYRAANMDIISDLPYGRFMRQVAIFISRYGFLDPVVRAAEESPELRDALYDAVSGHDNYRAVLGNSFKLDVAWAIIKSTFTGSDRRVPGTTLK